MKSQGLASDLDAPWRGVDVCSLELLGMENHLAYRHRGDKLRQRDSHEGQQFA